MNYTFRCTITDVFERKIKKFVSGSGPDAVFSTASAGWYMQIDGMVSLFVGAEQPGWSVGDKIELILCKP